MRVLPILLLATAASVNVSATDEIPYFADQVAAGTLPPVQERLPSMPRMLEFDNREIGEYGGRMRLLMAKSKDTRQMVVYGYARLLTYDQDLNLVPDILRDFQVEENRRFTLHLRPGHKWSDGTPFTTEDFRYFWEDVANNPELSPVGPPKLMLVDGKPPEIEYLDEHTIRYTWHAPNPHFLPRLAGTRPLYVYRPAHYLKQFHPDYADADKIAAMVAEAKVRNWVSLHVRAGNQYKYSNPDLPTLQPWYATTRAPAERFIFKRNPFYHRVDPRGRQLPYIDEVVMYLASSGLIPAKTGAGESDLQARYLRLDNYTFLRAGEKNNDFNTRLWRTGKGSQIALFPNLNTNDETWRKLMRDTRFRRALSLGIDRHEINQVVYFGLVIEGNNTVLSQSPLFRDDYQTRWARFDLDAANQLLDELGLTERNDRGLRLLPDGRPMEIVVQTAGESTEETDVLELIHDSWMRLGIKLYSKPSQREVFRNRIHSGDALMSVAAGMDNGLPTPDMSPLELSPTDQNQYQWPKWGQHFETGAKHGEEPDLPLARELLELSERWERASDTKSREEIWHRMLGIHAEEVYTIGLVCGVLQPVVVNNHLRNVPNEGFYNWYPGAFFGIYQPDSFWFTAERRN